MTIVTIKLKAEKVRTFLTKTWAWYGSSMSPKSNVNLTMDVGTEVALPIVDVGEDGTYYLFSNDFIGIFPPNSFELISIKHMTTE